MKLEEVTINAALPLVVAFDHETGSGKTSCIHLHTKCSKLVQSAIELSQFNHFHMTAVRHLQCGWK